MIEETIQQYLHIPRPTEFKGSRFIRDEWTFWYNRVQLPEVQKKWDEVHFASAQYYLDTL